AFDRAMEQGKERRVERLGDVEWKRDETVVDVGGGTGSLLVAILHEHPDLRGTLVDLPETTRRARTFLAQHGVVDRVSLSEQSFFDPLPRGGDLYLLHRVLNDWPDADKVRILRRCAGAMGRDSRLVVLGGVTADGEEAASPELLMLVLLGAGDCSLARFRTLAAEAGLRVRGARTPPVEHGIAVECVLA
ncbi:MAG: methyltransferase, partial [Solirubrobacteraceae bacterium]